jgi:hypothetical protein
VINRRLAGSLTTASNIASHPFFCPEERYSERERQEQLSRIEPKAEGSVALII